MSTTEQLAELIERINVATSSLDNDDDALRAMVFQRLLAHELGDAQASVGMQLRPNADREVRINQWTGRPWTPEQRLEELADRWSIHVRCVRGVIDPTPDQPWLCLPAAALDKTPTQAIRQIALLLTDARVDSLYNTNVVDVQRAAQESGLDAAAVAPVLESMHEREILLIDDRRDQPCDIYLLESGHRAARAVAQALTCHGH